MNTIFGNFLERTIPNLRNAIINLTIGGNNAEMNLEDFKVVMAPEPNYKVYTALLTQTGTDEPLELVDGDSVTKGVTYYIDGAVNGDFSNVGGPIITGSGFFVATINGVPNNYGGTALTYNLGAPTVTVLENTIGNIWFTYENIGNYNIQSNTLFTVNKTYCSVTLSNYNSDSTNAILGPVNDSSLKLITLLPTEGTFNFSDTAIEIRVYN